MDTSNNLPFMQNQGAMGNIPEWMIPYYQQQGGFRQPQPQPQLQPNQAYPGMFSSSDDNNEYNKAGWAYDTPKFDWGFWGMEEPSGNIFGDWSPSKWDALSIFNPLFQLGNFIGDNSNLQGGMFGGTGNHTDWWGNNNDWGTGPSGYTDVGGYGYDTYSGMGVGGSDVGVESPGDAGGYDGGGDMGGGYDTGDDSVGISDF
jgi:hypothetical protein